VILIGSGGSALALAGNASHADAGPPAAAATPPTASRDTIYYVNKTGNVPNVDGTWDAAAWAKGKAYDISGGQGRAYMYIMFTAIPQQSTWIYIGIDVPADQSNDPGTSDLLALAFDGDNDGQITYTNTDPSGSDLGCVWPLTLGGPCRDRWAQIAGGNTNDAGWMNMWNGAPQLWRVTGGYEHTDKMSSGFSDHRFYEYAIDYHYELGLGAHDHFGLNIGIFDGQGHGSVIFPSNRVDERGPFAEFMLAQAPVANIDYPVNNGWYYQNDTLDFSSAGTTDEDLKTVAYQWSFDEGATCTTATAPHSFARLGQHTVSLQVTDANGLTDTRTIVVNIKERNVAPVINSFFPPGDPLIQESDRITFTVNFTDANLVDKLYVNWTVNDAVVKTGLGLATSSHTFQTGWDPPYAKGTYAVNVSIQDTYDGGSPDPTTHGWLVTVSHKNRPPIILAAQPDIDQVSVPEGGNLSFSIEYMDPDNDTTTVWWYVDNDTLPGSRNHDSIVWSPDYNSSGIHRVRAVVNDTPVSGAERAWTAYVSNVDRPPAITSASPSQQEVSVDEGRDLIFTIVKFDPDHEPLSVQWFIGDDPVPGSNNTTYVFHANYNGDHSAESGPFTVRVVVRDPGGLGAERSWDLEVTDVNRPPVVIIDDPSDNEEFRLGSTVKFRADRSWDPDSEDNSTLQYAWDFGDGKTGGGPSGSHKYATIGYYTVKLTVRDHATSVSSLVHLYMRAPVLWVTDILVVPTFNIREDRSVNLTIRVSNNGDANATDVRIRLSLDGGALATLNVPELDADDKQEVTYLWTAVKGTHTFNASIDPAADTIVPAGSASEKTITVKARVAPAAEGIPSWALGLAGAFAAIIVLAAAGWMVLSRRRKAARPAPAKLTDGSLSAGAAFAALTRAPSAPEAETPVAPPDEAGAPAPEGTAATSGAEAAGPVATGAAAAAPEEAAPSAEPPAAPEQAPFPAPTTPETPVQPAPLACAACGEPAEPEWKLCPACGAPLASAPASAATGEPAATPFSGSLNGLRKRMDVQREMGRDTSQVLSTLDLAASFHRTGKEEKTQKYLEKARELLEDMEKA
jgi:hypothetical protein